MLSSLQISLVDEIRILEETFNILHERTESESVDGYASYPPTDKYGRFALLQNFQNWQTLILFLWTISILRWYLIRTRLNTEDAINAHIRRLHEYNELKVSWTVTFGLERKFILYLTVHFHSRTLHRCSSEGWRRQKEPRWGGLFPSLLHPFVLSFSDISPWNQK